MVSAGSYTSAGLPVHVRFKRASGFIRDIKLTDTDWESGSARYFPATGVVEVYIGRPSSETLSNVPVAIRRRSRTITRSSGN